MQRQKASHRAAKQMISFSLGTRRIRLRRRRVLRGVCGIFTAVLKNPLNRIVSPGRVSECGKIVLNQRLCALLCLPHQCRVIRRCLRHILLRLLHCGSHMQTVSDKLCREYGLSVIEHPQQGRGKQYGEWRAEQEQRPTWRGLIRADIDEAIRQSMTERQFFDALRKKGYAVKVGKDISVRPPGKERFVRLMRNFGEDYSLNSIRRRILSQSRPEREKPKQTPEILRVRLIGSLKTTRKLTGFRALYVHYCYLLGISPKNRPQQSRKRLHFLLREDLLKLDATTAETRLIVGHRIDTAEQLFCYRDEVNGKIEVLTADRKQLYKLQRTAAVKSGLEKAAEVKAQIDALSKELAALRKEVVLCNSIAERSGVIQEKIKAVREDEQPERKEKTDHVQFR